MPERESPIRVVIADDHTLFRAGLKKLLETLRELSMAPHRASALLLTASIETDQILEALKLGARGSSSRTPPTPPGTPRSTDVFRSSRMSVAEGETVISQHHP